MKVTKEDLEQREVALTIQVEDGDLPPYYDKAYRRLVQRINVPGFRKGKAPRTVVQRLVGDEVMLEEAMEFFIPEAVQKAVKEQGVEQGGAPSVEVTNQKDPIILRAKVPLTPKVTLTAYRDIRLQPQPTEVTDEEVGKVLEDMRWAQAPWGPVDRPVEFGDRVTMDARGEVEGKEVTNQIGVEFYATEGSPIPLKGFAEAVLGAKTGEEKRFTVKVPDDFGETNLAGKDCTFQVKVHEIKAKLLPELDDEFAKGVEAGYDSLEALKTKLREDLKARKEADSRVKHEDSVVEELAQRAAMEISPMLVDHEAQHILEDEEDTLKRQRVSVDQYLALVGRGKEEHVEDVRKEATNRILRVYALNKVAELEGLTATDDEIEEEITSLSTQNGREDKTLRRNLSQPDSKETIAKILVRRKAIARLAAIAKE